MRPQAIIAVLAGTLAAVLLVILMRQPESAAELPSSVASGRTPAFHEFGPRGDRPAELQKSLDVITSATAQSLGAHKDDIALLCSDPEVRTKVVSAYEARWRLSKYEAAAFADIFMLVRAPEFVAPTREIFAHPDFEVRSKGPQIAVTQAHPSLTQPLLRFYGELDRDHAGEGAQTRITLLAAAAACGGNEFPLILEMGLKDPNPNVRCSALDLLASHALAGFRETIAGLTKAGELAVRLRALAALTPASSVELEREVQSALVPESGPERNFALETILARKMRGMLPHLGALRSAVPAAEEGVIATTMAMIGDDSVLQEMRKVLADAPPGRRDRWLAVQVLAAAGTAADVSHLATMLRERRSGDALAAASGFNVRSTGCPREILEVLLEGDLSHPGQIAALVTAEGEAVLPIVGPLLDAARDPARAAFLIGIAGIVGTPDARRLILERHDQFPQLVEQQVRLLDLAARRRGVSP